MKHLITLIASTVIFGQPSIAAIGCLPGQCDLKPRPPSPRPPIECQSVRPNPRIPVPDSTRSFSAVINTAPIYDCVLTGYHNQQKIAESFFKAEQEKITVLFDQKKPRKQTLQRYAISRLQSVINVDGSQVPVYFQAIVSEGHMELRQGQENFMIDKIGDSPIYGDLTTGQSQIFEKNSFSNSPRQLDAQHLHGLDQVNVGLTSRLVCTPN